MPWTRRSQGHAHFIEVEVEAEGFVTVTDNGRGIPVDPHPKFKNKSALEVIMTTLHAGGKFDSEVYGTSGGLHGVGVSVANALSERMEVEVARGGQLYAQAYVRGKPKSGLQKLGKVNNRRGTKVRFKPDPEIFGAKAKFNPLRAVQDDARQGLPVRRRRNPLAMRSGAHRRPTTCRRKRPSISRRGSRIISRPPSTARRWCIPTFSPASRRRRAATARSNGRSASSPTPIRSCRPTATPSRRRTAAPTSWGCAAPSPRASRITPSAPTRASAPPRSPATT